MSFMKCQRCGERESTTHVKRIINGKTEEYYLCQECAAQMGYGSLLTGMPFPLESFLGNYLVDGSGTKGQQAAREDRCPLCGSSFQDIASSGKVGCAQCYATFYEKLLPSLQRIHGKTRHAGKIPASEGPKAMQRRQLEELKKKMSAAVEAQDFESAANLRDEIKALERGAQE